MELTAVIYIHKSAIIINTTGVFWSILYLSSDSYTNIYKELDLHKQAK